MRTAQHPGETDSTGTRRRTRRTLALILTLGLVLRIMGIEGSGFPYSFYPDETNNVERAVAFYHPGKGFDLNPHWFNKPALAYYLHFVEFGLHYVVGRYVRHDFTGTADFATRFLNGDRGTFYLIARYTHSFFGLLTIWAAYRVGKSLRSRRAGLFAAFCIAISPGHVEWAQVLKKDVMAAFFSLLALGFILAIARKARPKDYVLAGAVTGIGWAVKYTPAAMLLPLLSAHFLRTRPLVPTRWNGRGTALALAFVSFIGAAFLGSPYNFLDPTFVRASVETQLGALGRMLGLFGVGEVDPATDSVFTQLLRAFREYSAWYSFTPPIALLSGLGLLWSFKRCRRADATALVLAAGAVLFLITAANTQYPKPNHVIYLMPFGALAAGLALEKLTERLEGRGPRWRHAGAGLVLFLLLPIPGFPTWSHALRIAESRHKHSYLRAFDWIQENLEADTTLIDDGEILPLKPDDRRYEWIMSRIDAEIAVSRDRIARVGSDRDKVLHHRNRIATYETNRARFQLMAEAAKSYPQRRYDVIALMKPWQSERGRNESDEDSSYNEIWEPWPPLLPAGPERPPVERLRVLQSEIPVKPPASIGKEMVALARHERKVHPVIGDHRPEFLITSEISYENYETTHKRQAFPEWAEFYADLKAHYDCIEFAGTRRRIHWSGWPFEFHGDEDTSSLVRDAYKNFGQWNVRIYDLRRRIEDREPVVKRLD